ncbi:MAG: hypothetical protein ABSB36_09920 [Candidatus Dormibacteria bacterium]|jgi:putative restriction endonuclease
MARGDWDAVVRTPTFASVVEHTRRHSTDILRRALLAQGFVFEGMRVPRIGPEDIFKPAALPELPLSILTAPKLVHRPARVGAGRRHLP